MAQITEEQRNLKKAYDDAKKMLENSNPEASRDRHDALLNAFNRAKHNLKKSGYPYPVDATKMDILKIKIKKMFERDL